MTFLEKLYILLDNKRMTGNMLLRELNLNKSSIQNWRRQGSKPRVETMEKIADYFNVDFDSLRDDDLELQYISPVGNWNVDNGGTDMMSEHEMKTKISAEEYREMYDLEKKRANGLRAMAEDIIPADRKIIIDIKTTGSDYRKDEIVWLTIIDTDGNVLYDRVLAPERDYHRDFRYISQRTGINFDLISEAPTLTRQLYKINKILISANTIIGYPSGKLMAFLRKSGCMWRSDYELITLDKAFEDTIAEITDKENATLEECAAFWDYEWQNEGTERSTLDNCRAILHCYNRMIEEGYELGGY